MLGSCVCKFDFTWRETFQCFQWPIMTKQSHEPAISSCKFCWTPAIFCKSWVLYGGVALTKPHSFCLVSLSEYGVHQSITVSVRPGADPRWSLHLCEGESQSSVGKLHGYPGRFGKVDFESSGSSHDNWRWVTTSDVFLSSTGCTEWGAYVWSLVKAQSLAVPMCPSCVALHGLWCWDRWVPRRNSETAKQRNGIGFLWASVDATLGACMVLWCSLQALIPTQAIRRCKDTKKCGQCGPLDFFCFSVGFKIGSFDPPGTYVPPQWSLGCFWHWLCQLAACSEFFLKRETLEASLGPVAKIHLPSLKLTANAPEKKKKNAIFQNGFSFQWCHKISHNCRPSISPRGISPGIHPESLSSLHVSSHKWWL